MNFNKIKNSNSGFTLMELILVVALIGLMAVFTLVAIDPARRIGNARNSIRNSDAQNIEKAINSYALDNDALPAAFNSLTNGVNYMIAAAGDTSGATANCAAVGSLTKVDLTNGASTLFNYLATMPVDPEQTTPYTNGTGYYFRKQGNVLVTVKPCNFYVDPNIPLPPPPAITGIVFPGYGTEHTLNSSGMSYNTALDTIDSTHAIVMYDQYTKVLTLSGSSVTGNTQSTAASVNDEATITYLTTNKVVNASSYTIPTMSTRTNIGTTSANPTTWAGAQNLNSVLPRYPRIKKLDSTHVVLIYSDSTGSTNVGKAVVGTVGATTITWGAEATFTTDSAYFMGLAVLDSTHFVISYLDNNDNTRNGNVRVGSVSGTTITWDTAETDFETGEVNKTDIAALGADKFIISFLDYADNYKPKAIVGSISGGSITFGTSVTLSNSLCNNLAIDAIDSTHAVIVYSAGTAVAKADVATISGNEITMLAAPVSFDGGNISFPAVTVLDTNNFLISYQDNSSSDQPKVIAGTITWQ